MGILNREVTLQICGRTGEPIMSKQQSMYAVVSVAVVSALVALPLQSLAQEDSPIKDGAYIAPMYSSVLQVDEERLDDGTGGVLAIGFRRGFYAVEIAGSMADFRSAKATGGGINGLLFPLSSLPGAYVTAGFSALNYQEFESAAGDVDFNVNNLNAGLGYIFPITWGRYQYGLRAEARYSGGRRERDYNDLDIDIDAPRNYEQVILSIGLQLPTRLKQPEAPPVAEPVSMVEPLPPADSDGDGVSDNIDQCPGTPRGTEVDSVGCSLPPPSPPPACNGNSDGQSIALGGCEAGETLVLRGVNFEFDQDRLTTNAKTLLGEVVAELEAHPDIAIEIAGHTDAKGSEAYNQSLSERRAQSVVSYLVSNGIAQSRLTASGYGESQPIADNETEEGRELNRHVELTIAGRDDVQRQPETPAAAGPDPVVADDAAPPQAPAAPTPAPAPKSESDNELEFLLN
jgi:outer membrane protein OmpA-like peptidoglycan-associated protein